MTQLPSFVWGVFVTSWLGLLAPPVLLAVLVRETLDHIGHSAFFVPSGGGSAYLWENLFWFFGYPEVYICRRAQLGRLAAPPLRQRHRAGAASLLHVLNRGDLHSHQHRLPGGDRDAVEMSRTLHGADAVRRGLPLQLIQRRSRCGRSGPNAAVWRRREQPGDRQQPKLPHAPDQRRPSGAATAKRRPWTPAGHSARRRSPSDAPLCASNIRRTRAPAAPWQSCQYVLFRLGEEATATSPTGKSSRTRSMSTPTSRPRVTA